MKKNIYFLVILLGKFCELYAQDKLESSKFQHQIDVGINYSKYFDTRKNYSGFGIDLSRKEGGRSSFFAYKLIINNKHIFKLATAECSSNDWNILYNNYALINTYSKILDFGYGYHIPIKKVNVTVFCNLSYRYGGNEFIQIYNPDIDWVTNNYNSMGCSTNLDFEFFFTKNLAAGINLCYYMFPFESSKINIDANKVDGNIFNDFKPINNFFNITFKLAYKFNFSKFNKKN